MSKPTKTVFVVTGKSESGDSYGPVVFNGKPTDKILQQLCEAWDFGDGDGPGAYGSFVHLSVDKCTVRDV